MEKSRIVIFKSILNEKITYCETVQEGYIICLYRIFNYKS